MGQRDAPHRAARHRPDRGIVETPPEPDVPVQPRHGGVAILHDLCPRAEIAAVRPAAIALAQFITFAPLTPPHRLRGGKSIAERMGCRAVEQRKAARRRRLHAPARDGNHNLGACRDQNRRGHRRNQPPAAQGTETLWHHCGSSTRPTGPAPCRFVPLSYRRPTRSSRGLATLSAAHCRNST